MPSPTCIATGAPLPEDARTDYAADPTCTHFYCASCGKLLRLPSNASGTVRKHVAEDAEGDPWPFGADPTHQR